MNMKKMKHLTALVLIGILVLIAFDAAHAASKMRTHAPQLQAGPTIWQEGKITRQAWMSLSEAALFLKKDVGSGAAVRGPLRSVSPDAVITAEQGRTLMVSMGRSASAETHAARIRSLHQIEGVQAARPVFYSSSTADPGTKMVLTEDIIVQFPAKTPPLAIREFEKRYGLKRIHAFGFTRNAYIYDAGDPMRCLALANELVKTRQVLIAYPDWIRTRTKRVIPDDTLFPNQWHLRNTGQSGGTVGEDVDIVTVWDTYRGSSSEVIAIVDDGLEIDHPDLSANVRSDLCWDYVDNEADTTDGDHGTSCAGVAAGRGFNGEGISGAAPAARLVGHRILPESGGILDSDVVDALTDDRSVIDIYSNSWGPTDGGYVLDGPSSLVLSALATGVATGRGNLGSIYLWAGGNGYDADNSNYDGYANSRYVIAVAASTNYGIRASYSEKGANILVNSPSNGGSLGITTTDRTGNQGYSSGDYTSTFGGTSSATPLAAGIVALMLQANPNLTWRDVRAILVQTAEQNDPTDSDWTTNGAGHHINHKYGFGRIDAQAAVTAAASWTNLAEETSAQGMSSPGLSIPDNNATGVSDTISIDSEISIEFVEVTFSAANHTYWPDLEVTLVSPDGTQSILAETHSASSSPSGSYDDWRFGTVRHFGENSQGTWTLRVRDLASGDTGTFQSWTLNIYGTQAASDTTAPVISDVSVSDLTDSTATITWTTDEESDGTVSYGTSNAEWEDYPSEAHVADASTSHSVTLTGLTDGTTYYFRVGSTDASGNGPGTNQGITNPSDEQSFTTTTDAPTITGIAVSRTPTTATITWTTDEPADSSVHYGPSTSSWGSYPSTLSDTALATAHSVTVTGLAEETTYYFMVGSTDASGNGPGLNENATNPSDEQSFTTTYSVPSVSGTPRIDFSARTVTITFNESGMLGAASESAYRFSPSLSFRTSGGTDDVVQISSSTYRLYMSSIPRYTIYRLTLSGITDADGHSLSKTSFTLNDTDSDRLADDWESFYGVSRAGSDDDGDGLTNLEEFTQGTSPIDSDTDGDGLPDAWEVRYDLDPLDDAGLNGASGDLDGDGWTNIEEYRNGTNPDSATSPVPEPPQVVEVHPHDGAGVSDATRIPANASFAVRLHDEDGIDLTDTGSIILSIDDGVNEPYTVTLADTDVVRVVKLSSDADTAVRSLWVVYDRSRESALGDFPYGETIIVTVQAGDRVDDWMDEQSYSFRVETEQDHQEAAAASPSVTALQQGDPVLKDGYDAGIQVLSGALAGAKVVYSGDEPVVPEFGPSDEIDMIGLDGVNTVGEVLNLQPPTIFNSPVKVFIPCSGYSDLTVVGIYLYGSAGWVLACDGAGVVQPGGEGWMVEGSRVDHPETSPPTIEIGVYHFTAVQAGSTEEPDIPTGSSGGGGGGGCFIGAAGL